MYIDPITRQIFGYTTPIFCDIYPQNVLPLDPDKDEHYVVNTKPVLRATQSAISRITFTAQEAGSYSNAELTTFWNRGFFNEIFCYNTESFGKSLFIGHLSYF